MKLPKGVRLSDLSEKERKLFLRQKNARNQRAARAKLRRAGGSVVTMNLDAEAMNALSAMHTESKIPRADLIKLGLLLLYDKHMPANRQVG